MNSEPMGQLLEEARKIRTLLELLAEPAIAQRDSKLRSDLKTIVGSSRKKQQSALLMDGERTRGEIATWTGIDQSDLSKLVSKLDGCKLLVDGKKQPKLAIAVPQNFFDAEE